MPVRLTYGEDAMKNLAKATLRLVAVLAITTCSAWGEAQAPPVGKASEWLPSASTMEKIRLQCAKQKGLDFGTCFVDSMKRAGATPQAVAFARATGNTGYLSHFLERGRVDLAFVRYPFRANENQGWILVNGAPAMIDVDSLSELPKGRLTENPTYRALKEKYSKILLFGGDRDITQPPEMIILPDKGQRFIVGYRLLNGCHACEQVGSVRFSFDFKPDGTFLGSTLVDVQ
jgi:hypothetical protein